jgi:hypothetical protein
MKIFLYNKNNFFYYNSSLFFNKKFSNKYINKIYIEHFIKIKGCI